MLLSKRHVAAWLSVFGLVLPVAAQQAGRVGASVTKTTLARGTAPRVDATAGTSIDWNDVIQTDHHGRVRIALNDGSLLTLGSDSQLRVVKHDAQLQQTQLEMKYGRIRAQVTSIIRGGSFELRTPTAVAGVIGTDFGADATEPGQTKFVCLSGTTRIYTPDKSSYVDCGPGMTITVFGGQVLASPTPADATQTERWKHITEPGDSQFADTIPQAQLKPPPIKWNNLQISGSWRVRAEMWNWFDAPTYDNSYIFPQSILRFAIGQQNKAWDWQIEIAQPTLLALPGQAVAPAPLGQLGLGGTYFAANGNSQNAAYIFPSKAFVKLKGLGKPSNELTVGRFAFIDGAETTPQNKTLATLKATRIAHRLLGDFGFSVTGRSADGFKLSLNPGKANLTFAAARATRGVYQVDGLGELDVAWEYGALTIPTGTVNNGGELRLFGLGYQDARAVVKTDNRPAAARSGADQLVNINIGTFGMHYLHQITTQNAGTFDFLLWGVGQVGQWGLQDQRAGAVAVEAGWQPKSSTLKPWLRFGYSIGTGDGNPNDNQHNTFFQVLPTPRIYARFPFFNMMNMNDAFGMLILRPTSRWNIRSDGHSLWLASRKDLWYGGGGAFQPHTFGFTGRPSLGARGLGWLWDVSADYQVSRRWTVGAYYGHVWGSGVPGRIYPTGSAADFGYVETTLRF
jgi:hypothetical protein